MVKGGVPAEDDFDYKDEYLKRETHRVLNEREDAGLNGLVGGLACVILNTEPDRQRASVQELLTYTGLELAEAFEDSQYRTCVLKTEGSADFLVRSRKSQDNPFASFNRFPRSRHLPNTRLETFVFETHDIEKYVSIQKQRGVNFLTESAVHTSNFSFIQTVPSRFTGNSTGFIQWKRGKGVYFAENSKTLNWRSEEPTGFDNIKELDHAATRVKAEDREAAIIEFMELTNYNFDMAIYVKAFNSITNVARLSEDDYAMVFTSGISSYKSDEESGPTEKFIHNYGQRVHHVAFRTESIDETFEALKSAGMTFLIDLVGSPEEGLKQTFSDMSQHTLLVNEYIHRYGDFDGFFTKSNVTLLTEATDKQ